MAQCKGRVIKQEGTVITIDTTPDPRQKKGEDAGGIIIGGSWDNKENPQVGAVVRINFKNRDVV